MELDTEHINTVLTVIEEILEILENYSKELETEEWQSRFENYQLKNAIAKIKSANKAILPRIQQGETKGRKHRREGKLQRGNVY